MYKPQSHAGGMLLAALAAGPLFATSSLLAGIYLMLPQAIPIQTDAIGLLAAGLVFSLIPGMIIGLLLNGLGTVIMMSLASRFAAARSAASWTIVGGLAGLGIAWLLGFVGTNPPILFALIMTSAICAWICQYQVNWRQDD
jgi:hypothetical protein